MPKTKMPQTPPRLRGPSGPIKKESAVVEITLGPDQAALIGHEFKAIAAQNRFAPDLHSWEMKLRAGNAFKAHLNAMDIQRLRQFGDATAGPVLLVRGAPKPEFIPPTPHLGFNVDESRVAESDLLLLGLFDVAGIEPVAYEYENYGHLFRNVVPNPDLKDEKSSQGFNKPLGWHTDNPCGPFELDRRTLALPDRSPIPRFLGFTSLRNRDKYGNPVPTEVSLVARALDGLDEHWLAILFEWEFQVNPPASNKTGALSGVPLVISHGGRYLVRFNADPELVFGLTERARLALDAFKAALRQSEGEALKFDLEPGRLLVIDNYRVCHRRESFEPGDNWPATRWLRRCYGCMSIENGRFRDRLHSPNLWL